MAAVVALGCGNEPQAPVEQLGADAATYWPGASWPTATPAQVGVDGAAITNLVTRLRSGALGPEHALVIVRKGYVITDEYFAGWMDAATLQPIDPVRLAESSTRYARGYAAGAKQYELALLGGYDAE